MSHAVELHCFKITITNILFPHPHKWENLSILAKLCNDNILDKKRIANERARCAEILFL